MEDNLPSNPVLKARSESMRTYISPSKDSSPSKAKNIFVQGKKLKKTVSTTSDIGFEYDLDVLNDDDFYRKIFEQNCYHPSYENLIDYYLEIKRKMESYDDQDRRNLGALVGVTVLSLIGFFAFSFTVVGGIAGGVLGGTIGRYAGKKLKKKLKKKEPLIQEELYRIKLQCMIKLGKLQKNLLKHNLNKYRTIIEKIIEESTPGFRFTVFQYPDKMVSTVLKLRAFLLTVQAQKALLLSYKLFKIHFKQVTWEDSQGVQEAADKLNKVLIPYTKLMEIDAKTDGKTLKKLTNLVTYRKIKNLMLKPEIIQILEQYPDPRTSAEYIEKFRSYMKEKVDIESQIKENERMLPQIVAQLQNVDVEQVEEEMSKIEIQVDSLKAQYKLSENINPDEIDEDNTNTNKDNIRSLELPKNKMLGDDLDQDSVLKQSLPKRQGVCQMLQPKSPLSGHLECPSAEQIQMVNRIVDDDDDSSETDDKPQEDEEKLEDDPALYIDLEKANNPIMSVSEPRKKVNLPPKIKMAKEEILQEIMEGASPTRKGYNRMTTRRIEPTSLNNLDMGAEVHPASYGQEAVKMNTYTNLPMDEVIMEAEEMKKEYGDMSPIKLMRDGTRSPTKLIRDGTRSPTKFMRDGNRSPTRIMRDEVEAKFSELVVNKQASKTKKEMIFEKVLAIAYDEESKWEKVCQNPVIRIHKIKPEDSPVVLLRAWAFLEGITPAEVFDHIYDTAARAQWDNVLADLQVVEKIDYETEVISFVIKTPFGITERDFVQKRQFQHDYPEKGTITMSFQSTTHPAKPPTKGRIRGETHIAGYVIKPSAKDPGSTDMCILSQVDIKGNIPKVIVNMVSGKAPADWVNKLKKACESDRKKKK